MNIEMKKILAAILLIATHACNDEKADSAFKKHGGAPAEIKKEANHNPVHYTGAVSNGMKGDSISFDVSGDGKRLENFLFKGYWRCSGHLEQQPNAGPQGYFTISDGKVDGQISEPPNGGSTAWRYDLKAEINNKEASGTFRMNINNLGCDTYILKWTATAN